MSANAPTQPGVPHAEAPDAAWHVRAAAPADAAAVAAAVGKLLVELGGTPPDQASMEATTLALLQDRDAGAVLVAQAGGSLVGVLAASWQSAIHIPGRYGLIQDLWVDPAWRSNAIGAALLATFAKLTRERQMTRIEVGLPRESFAGLAATAAFYERNGFAAHGPRMRMVLG